MAFLQCNCLVPLTRVRELYHKVLSVVPPHALPSCTGRHVSLVFSVVCPHRSCTYHIHTMYSRTRTRSPACGERSARMIIMVALGVAWSSATGISATADTVTTTTAASVAIPVWPIPASLTCTAGSPLALESSWVYKYEPQNIGRCVCAHPHTKVHCHLTGCLPQRHAEQHDRRVRPCLHDLPMLIKVISLQERTRSVQPVRVAFVAKYDRAHGHFFALACPCNRSILIVQFLPIPKSHYAVIFRIRTPLAHTHTTTCPPHTHSLACMRVHQHPCCGRSDVAIHGCSQQRVFWSIGRKHWSHFDQSG
jgi:hypothetical protein